MAMRVRADRLPFETGVVTERIYPTSQLLSEIIGFAVQPNKAVVGRNAFAHEAGIHQHGVINNPLCYEIMTPDSVGVPSEQPRPRQALGPPRARAPLRRTRPRALGSRTRRGLPPLHRTGRPQEAHLRSGLALAAPGGRAGPRRSARRRGSFRGARGGDERELLRCEGEKGKRRKGRRGRSDEKYAALSPLPFRLFRLVPTFRP